MHYCFRCGQWKKLNRHYQMCAECVTLWLSATPTERRRLLHAVPTS